MTLLGATVGAIVLAARNGAAAPRSPSPPACCGRGSDITIKALSDHSDLGLGVIVHPFALVILVWSLAGLLVSAKSLQLGPVVAVIAITSATANILTIAAGPTVFQEPLPEDRARCSSASPRSRW